MAEHDDEEVLRLGRIISHPLRLRIVRALAQSAEEPISPQQLVSLTGGTLGTVSYHVRKLEELGVVELAQEVPRRGAIQHFWRLTGEGRKLLSRAGVA